MHHRSLAIAALLAALTSCNTGRRELSDCPLISGKFTAVSTLVNTSGTCSQAKSVSTDTLTFAQGVYQFPISGVAQCRTDQVACDITVHCTSPLLTNARFVFDGSLSTDGTQLSGTATFTGSYEGCTLVVYSVDATLQ